MGNGLIVALGALALLSGCSDTVEWREEVRFNDGRLVEVTQKRRCEGGNPFAKLRTSCLPREAWLTVRLPEFAPGDIVWHEGLMPKVLNVHEGRLYLVGFPHTTKEFRAYGATNPPYFGFRWSGGRWERIPFAEIPVAIYDANLVIEVMPSTPTEFLTLAEKNSVRENGDPAFPRYLRRIDPAFQALAH